MALVHEFADDGDHFGNMVRGRRVVFRGLHVQGLQILEKCRFIGFGKCIKGGSGLDCPGDGLVVHIRQVHHLENLIAEILDAAPE